MRHRLMMAAALVLCSFVASGQTPATPEELMKQVFAALESKDQPALERLTVTRAEFKKYLWPTMASRVAGPNMNADKYFSMSEKSNNIGVADRLAEFGGHGWKVIKVSFGNDIKQSKGFRWLPSPEVTVRDESGQDKMARVVAGVLEHDGACKVTNFYVRPAQTAQQ